MVLKQFVKLGFKHIKHDITEAIYLKTGIDFTKPRVIQGTVNERCNYKCRYCDFWRLEHYQDEMTITQWQKALLSLKEFIGGWYYIQFVGGEPFLKKGFLDLLEFCQSENIGWGVITNGSTFNNKTVKRIVAAQPIKIDISVDSATAEIHDFVRGVPGSLEKISQGIALLKDEKDRQGLKFPIRIKPTVHRYNFRYLPQLVEWTKQIGATTIDFSVVKPWTNEVQTELWIREPDDLQALEQIIETLIILKKEGAPIESSELKLRSFMDHFTGKPVKYGVLPCRLGIRDYQIRPNGDVQACWLYPSIGNVKTSSARDIWYNFQTKQTRAQMVNCDRLGKAGCGNFCLASQVNLVDQFQRGLTLLRQTF